MPKRKSVAPLPTNFDRTYEIEVDGWTIERGELVKVSGQYGVKFKFDSFVTNKLTGEQWVDCFEMSRGQVGVWRSFKIDRIKRIPRKRGSGLVRRRKTSTAS
jgi:hypothetical protein